MGRPLSRSGVAVINIGGVAFPPFAELFGPDKLPYRCVIISDGDPPKRSADATDDDEDEIDPALSPVAAALAAREGDKLRVRLAQRTLEWDLAAAGNWDVLLEALAAVKPRVAPAPGRRAHHQRPAAAGRRAAGEGRRPQGPLRARA